MNLRPMRTGLTGLALTLLCVTGLGVSSSVAQPMAATAAFTDSTAAGLGATKRVAIASVIVSFQASVAALKEGGSGMFANKTSSSSVLAITDFDLDRHDAIVAAAYQQLKAQLTAAGYEVVPETEIKASAAYAQILALSKIPTHTKFGNALGDALLVSPATLPGYLPYQGETGIFSSPKSYIGWTGAFGSKSKTEGGPSAMTIGGNWKIPGLEVQMAKELNANVVKAFYVVSIGEAGASRSRDFTGNENNWWNYSGQGSASAALGLMADQTRIAFRTPNGNAKWQKVSMMKVVPAKDGDVVVRLAEPLQAGGHLFHLESSSREGGLFTPGADFQFMFLATVTDPADYQRRVEALLNGANNAMVGLVKP